MGIEQDISRIADALEIIAAREGTTPERSTSKDSDAGLDAAAEKKKLAAEKRAQKKAKAEQEKADLEAAESAESAESEEADPAAATKEAVRKALTLVAETLTSEDVGKVLKQFGATTIGKLDPEHYAACIKAAEDLVADGDTDEDDGADPFAD